MRNLRKIAGLVVLAGVFSAPLFAQTAVKLEALLNKPAVSWADAAVFVLEASDAAVYSDSADAFYFAAGQKWLPKDAASGDTARLSGVALLLMQSFGLKGGLFYRIGKDSHHAYRDLVYQKIIRGAADPDMPVSGQELLLMVNRLLSLKEQEAEKAVQ